MKAFQSVYSHSSRGRAYAIDRHLVGAFVFHESHGHWHFENFLRFELRKITRAGIPGRVIRARTKVGFCLIPRFAVDPTLEHFGWARKRGYSCDERGVQGISVGFGDVYEWWLPGQTIDVSGVTAGWYFVVVTVDPANSLVESNDDNNSGRVRIHIPRPRRASFDRAATGRS